MGKNTLFFICVPLSLCGALLFLLLFASTADGMIPETRILTATAQLKALDRPVIGGDEVWEITLETEGRNFSVLLKSRCSFVGESGKSVPDAEEFFRLYKDRIITADLEKYGAVLECRVGGK